MVALRSLVLLCAAPSALSAPSGKNGGHLDPVCMHCCQHVSHVIGVGMILLCCFRCVARSCALALLLSASSGAPACAAGTVGGLEVYGRLAREFDYDLFRAAAQKTAATETYASVPTHPHCDAGGSGPVVLSAVTGARTALFPGGITQRSAPDFASAVSKLAGSASGPGEVAASALRTQALQTGMVRHCVLAPVCSVRDCLRCRLHCCSGPGADHGIRRCACGASSARAVHGWCVAACLALCAFVLTVRCLR